MQGYKAATIGAKGAPPKSAPTTNGVGANGAKKTNAKKKTEKAANGDSDGSARAPPPGFGSKPTSPTRMGFSEQQQRLLRHRALFVFRFLVGKAVEVTLVDSSRYIGILDCIDPDDFSIVLKNTQRKNNDGTATSEAIGSGSTVIFKRRQLAHMAADGVVNYGDGVGGVGAIKAASGFRTDTEITNRSHDHLYGRELESAASWLDPQLDTGELEDPRRRSSSKNQSSWNQFEANEKLFGVVSTFDENLYTTKLDKSKVSSEKSREAERLAREIEREATGNFHLQEERGQAVHGDDDLDEEARYSSVNRKQSATASLTRSANAYVPPALRNRPTSAGASGPKHVSPKTPTPASSSSPTPSPASTPAPKTPSTPETSAPAPTPAPAASTPPAPKPFSFSDAVRGRTTAKPAPAQPPAAPATAPAKQPAKQTVDQKPVAESTKVQQATEKPNAPASPVGAAVSSPKKSTSPQPTKKETKAAGAKSTTSAAPEAKAEAKADKKQQTKDSEKTTPASTDSTSTSSATTTTPAPAKKGLNPNAREFKLNASASAFTPKFATPPATASPYRQPATAGHYGGHLHAPLPHHGAMPMGYSPMPEEWMYDANGMMVVDESEYAAHAYMGYGMPMVPNPGMMPPAMYAPPMIPPQQNVRVPRGAAAGYAYNQPGMYNPRSYYGQQAAVPGMPYPPGAVPVAGGVPQPPLPPTDPVGADATPRSDAPSSNTDTPVKK